MKAYTLQVHAGDPSTRYEWVLIAEDRAWSLRVYRRAQLGEAWYADWLDAAGVAQVRGVGLVLGVDLLAPYRAGYDVPQGVLWVARTDALAVDPTGDDFAAGRAVVYYLPPESG